MIVDIDPLNLTIIEKKCKICGNMRKFCTGTPRDKESICGNCWDWENDPRYIKLTKEEAAKLQKLLSA